MKTTVKVPPLPADAGDEIVLTEWLVSAGQSVETGQVLAVVELAKSTMEIPSPVAGQVRELLCEIDDNLESGQPLCVVES